MKIAVLLSSYADSVSVLKDYDPSLNPVEHYPEGVHEFTTIHVRKATTAKQIHNLAKTQKFDVVINLCDGGWDEDRAGAEVVQYLEEFQVPYTGARPCYYNATKEHMKMAAHACGIDTPYHKFAFTAEHIQEALKELSFPMIVKPFNGYSSVGITVNSKVNSIEDLRREAERLISEFGGALIEEFVDGREFTVLVAENPRDRKQPIVFEPIECVIHAKNGFKHFESKMVSWEKDLEWIPVNDTSLKQRLEELSCKIFRGIGANSFGRSDFRMDSKTGKLFFLEINANCTVFCPHGQFGSADLILSMDPRGHKTFLDLILDCAVNDHRRKQKKYTLDFKKNDGYGMYAEVDIAQGETIYSLESQPQVLASLKNVQQSWDSEDQDLFRRYAWPLSDDIFVTWSEDPSEWKPINHSCNPNSWLDGLRVVARRPIKKGQQVTIDYGTFCGPTMVPFNCRCGADRCRQLIQPTDHLEQFIEELYGDHVSDYVRSSRRLVLKNGYKTPAH